MTEEEDSCGKKICKTTGSCLFGAIWDILTCPFICCYKCTYYSCQKCCCCKNNNSSAK